MTPAYVVMACVVMAYVVMARMPMAYVANGPYRYGLCRDGLCSNVYTQYRGLHDVAIRDPWGKPLSPSAKFQERAPCWKSSSNGHISYGILVMAY